jgi:hypothetical protein
MHRIFEIALRLILLMPQKGVYRVFEHLQSLILFGSDQTLQLGYFGLASGGLGRASHETPPAQSKAEKSPKIASFMDASSRRSQHASKIGRN